MMGLGSEALTIFIVDFGLAKQFHHLNTGLHILFHRSHHLTGTPAFASINSHLGAELGHRDDLESLVYVLIYLACGSLPWLDEANSPGSSVPLILNIKQTTPVELLCSGLPHEFVTLLTYTCSLSFSEEPDYNYNCLLFTALQNEIPDLEASRNPHLLDLCAEPLSITTLFRPAAQENGSVFPCRCSLKPLPAAESCGDQEPARSKRSSRKTKATVKTADGALRNTPKCMCVLIFAHTFKPLMSYTAYTQQQRLLLCFISNVWK